MVIKDIQQDLLVSFESYPTPEKPMWLALPSVCLCMFGETADKWWNQKKKSCQKGTETFPMQTKVPFDIEVLSTQPYVYTER